MNGSFFDESHQLTVQTPQLEATLETSLEW